MSSFILETLFQTSSNHRNKILSEYIRELLIDFLDLDSKDIITNDQNFIDIGTDSAQAVEFKLKLEKELECSLKTTLLFDYPRLDVLVNFLIEEILELDSKPKVDQNIEKDEKKENNKDSNEIAIVGMACRMPGGVMNPEDFWKLLVNNVNAIEEVPKSRWDIDQFYSAKKESGKVSNRYGGFIKHIEEFDPQFFGISSKEATEMDPQQRVLMEVAWEAIENSGQSAHNLKGKNIGVFVGIRSTEYYPLEGYRNPKEINFYSGIGTQLSAASGRLSYFLGLTGPSLSIDTACSSSMTALHFACESIRNNESEGALVGGVNILISVGGHVAASQGNMLSSDGFCKTFSSKADGYVRSEGCAVFYLKPLKKAQEDGDTILSVICATGTNQDGASGGLTIPYAPAQESLILKTLDNANLKPEDIDYVEAHGTGTPLGDPIEVQALNNTIGSGRNKSSNPLKIGSVKTNIGHTEPVAGLAGLMKTVLALQHEMIPSNLHADPPNPYIEWDAIPIEVVKENTPWYRNKKARYAGVSSFGFTGTNTHAIIKEAPLVKPSDRIVKKEKCLFVCSAKSEKALKVLVENYVKFFENTDKENIKDVCYTSVVGRSHFQYKLSLIEDSKKGIINSLKNSFKKDTSTHISKTKSQEPSLTFVIPNSNKFAPKTTAFLFNEYPVFKRIIEECDVYTHKVYKLSDFFQEKNNPKLSSNKKHNLVLHFTSLYAYAKCWMYWGVAPHFLLVNNQGAFDQILAACIAGVFDYKSAVYLLEGNQGYNNKKISKKEFVNTIDQIEFMIPQINIVTDATSLINQKQIATASYWKNQLIILNFDIDKKHQKMKTSVTESDIFLCIGSLQGIDSTIKNNLKEKKLLEDPFNQGNDNTLFLKNLQEIYHSGIVFNWVNFNEGKNLKKVTLPNYPFQRKFHWLESTQNTSNFHLNNTWQSENSHPLLGNKIQLALNTDQTIRYNRIINAGYPEFIKEHKVYNDIVVPGAAYIEMVIAAVEELEKKETIKHITLSDISIRETLVLKENENVTIQTSFLPVSSDNGLNQYAFKIHSLLGDSEKKNSGKNIPWKYHFNGNLNIEKRAFKTSGLDKLDKIKSRCPSFKSSQEHYSEMDNAGLHYGGSFQGIHKIWHNEKEALVQIYLPDQLKPKALDYKFHPVLLDSCFQGLSVLLSHEEKQEAIVPVGIQEIILYDSPDTELWCYINALQKIEDKHFIADFHIINKEGENIAFIKGLKLIRIKNTNHLKNSETKKNSVDKVDKNNKLYSISWITQPEKKTFISDKERMVEDPVSWLVLSDDKSIGSEFVGLLEKRQERVIEIFQDDIDYTDLQEWKDFIEDEFDESFAKLKGIVNLWGIGQTLEQEGLLSSIKLIQALEEVSKENGSKSNEKPRLWWVTKGGQSVTDDKKRLVPEQSTLWGLRSSLASEMVQYHPSCIDLDPAKNLAEKEAQQLLDETWNSGPENQIAFRSDNRYVARLSEYHLKEDILKNSSFPSELRINEYGILENLEWVPQNKEIPKNDEVQIAVAASALNFKDVLHTLGLLQKYSKEQGITNSKNQPLGFECSGLVTAVGNNVKDFNIGDAVIATSLNGCMKNFITVPSAYVIPKPSTLNMEEASSIPTVFMTALYGLEELAKIKKGDKVLIHACAGGVGQAALQIAQNAGAVVFATASKSKWDFLKSKGVEHIMDSRSLDYADQIKEITNGEGIDIVLNSLKGEFISKNFDVLAKNGKYIEIGKIDIWNQDKVKEVRPDINYHVFDLSDNVRNDEALYKELLLKITERFDKGELVSIPMTVFDITEARKAFTFLSQAKNIGKVVLSFPEIQEKNVKVLSENKNYLITGGLGGLGLKIAKKLGELGGKHVTLIGRSAPNDFAKEKIEVLKNIYHVNVQVIQSDISIKLETQKLFKTLGDSVVPLGGIVHAAGVLDDGILLQQSWDNFQKVMAPKMNGMWNLHSCTTEMDLDFFICFSSMASVMGASGQTNYAAANAYLDTFAKYRHDMNLPCLSMNWGPWKEGGMAANMNEKNQQRIKDMGINYLTDNEALNIFSNVLKLSSTAQIGVWDIDWINYFKSRHSNQKIGFLEDFSKHIHKNEDSILDLLLQKSIEERTDFFLRYMQEEIASLMGLDSPEEIEPKQPLFDLGVDSLVTIDLNNRLQKSIGKELDATLIFDYPNLEVLTQYILNDILELGEDKEQKTECIIDPIESIISDLTEEELANELSNLLE